MPAIRPVYWHAGQFLEPQHFQQADLGHQWLLAAQNGLGRSWPWGVAELVLDSGALEAGLISVSRARLHFPDGVAALSAEQLDEGNAIVEQRAFDQAWTDRQQPFTVHVGLAALRSKDNVAGVLPVDGARNRLPAERPGRFLAGANDEMTADRYALPHPSCLDTGAPVRTLYYYLRLFWDEEVRARPDYQTFPLIRLIDQGLGPRPDPDWSPPLVELAASPWLTSLTRAFEARLTALIRHLSPLRPDSIHRPGADPALALLSEAAQALSDLRLVLARPGAPPWELFGLLRRHLAGLSARIRSGGDLTELAAIAFDHQNPAPAFLALKEAYDFFLAGVLPEIEVELPLTVQNQLLVAELTDECLADRLSPILVLPLNEPPADLLAEGSLVSGEPEEVQEALRRALPVLPLKSIPAPPGLLDRAGLYYLSPDRRNPAWQRVKSSRRWATAVLRGRPEALETLAAQSRIIFMVKRGD